MKIAVSGLINVETTLKIRSFPVSYYPIDYPFFGIRSEVAGVAYNVTKALVTLGDETELFSMTGRDEEGKRILEKLDRERIRTDLICTDLTETPVSVVLYDGTGKRQIYCDLKDIQEQRPDTSEFEERIKNCDLAVLCNTNFNRPLLGKAKAMGKTIATDVHVLGDLEDAYNRDFLEAAGILFLSDEGLPCHAEEFLFQLKNRYEAEIIVIGCSEKGALLYERATGQGYSLEAAKLGGIVNTLGAGDALFSGFLHFYGKGFPAVDALIRAELFAAHKIRFDGASNGFCGEEVIEAYEKHIAVKRL